MGSFIAGMVFSWVLITSPGPHLDCTTSLALVDGTTNVYYDKQTCK